MMLRKKTFLFISALMSLFLIMLVALSYIVIHSSFLKLESQSGFDNLHRLKNAITTQMDYVEAKALDWGVWDTPYHWLEGKAPEFAKETLNDESAMSMKIDHGLYYDTERRMRGEIGWDFENEKGIDTPIDVIKFFEKESIFTTFVENKEAHRGFVLFESIGPSYVVTHPVVKSDFSGKRNGFVVFVKRLDSAELKRLSEVTKLKVDFALRNDVKDSDIWSKALSMIDETGESLDVINDNQIAGSFVLTEYQGKPDLLFRLILERRIMAAGNLTVKFFIGSAAIFAAVIALLLLIFMEKLVVGRVVTVTEEVNEIGRSGRSDLRVALTGKDEIRNLGAGINSMLTQIELQSAAIKAILDNVSVGLFMVDIEGNILKGYSSSLLHILGQELAIEGEKVWDMLLTSERDKENFEVLFLQASEDDFMAETLIMQLPERLAYKDKTLSIVGRIVRKEGSIDSVLFTLSDTTDLVKAEKLNEVNNSLLKILKRREVFIDLIKRFGVEVANVSKVNGGINASSTIPLKRNLHTWKGEFSVLGLRDVAKDIHEIEEHFSPVDQLSYKLDHLSESIWSFIDQHSEILSIDRGKLDQSDVLVSEDSISRLDAILESPLSTLHEIKAASQAFVHEAHSVSAESLLAYLQDGIPELNKKLQKKFELKLIGGEVKIPKSMRPVFQTFVHLVRNAADHGIEKSTSRGTKPSVGLIEIETIKAPGWIRILIRDDGKGIAVESLKARAVSKGLYSEDAWAMLSLQSQLAVIFDAGFSTAEVVSETSGRGVGLDAVKDAVESAGGTISIETFEGKGTTFIVEIPFS
ncbi:MAG: HAMP domain-containing protein [Proteobacteria bacterium]|nr:MAG: HAMP domain-containing protein [Pseudomonadota bacterium]